MSNLLQDIEAQIAGAKTDVARENVGVVREIGDGVAKIEGLTGAMMNEMLDFGGGDGRMLGGLVDRGALCHLVDYSERVHPGVTKIGDTEHDIPADANYDVIICSHVVEHLPDPRETLASVRRILKPGGRLGVAVPNFSSLQARLTGSAWFHLDLPRHLYQFPLSGLNQLLERSGFEVSPAHHFSLRQNPFGWIHIWQRGSNGFALNSGPGTCSLPLVLYWF